MTAYDVMHANLTVLYVLEKEMREIIFTAPAR